MAEKEFDKITIQDLSERADVSRRTVYLHYEDKFDLLDQLIAEHIGNLERICEDMDEDVDYERAGRLWFEYFESAASFFSALLTSKGSPFFRRHFLDFFIRELEKGTPASAKTEQSVEIGRDVEMHFLGAAMVGIVEWWFQNGRPYPPSTMASRLGTLLERNAEAVLSST
ncbi:TetR/AcrR family transcriptional regulator [Saccharibacillus alkalitolerans]|uniref:TetR/AcrR family transcriptional regulator n=1 Tax=Saccharibacillus alkalitolerans TaxID=2705290 RepID=A0ABX0F7T5_9BACL|nr:TetR/AcrR family transcriptional regulator [Saccharibacillus alkalitolerans]NGZ75266.1 TetR/AcrR family transcriptional regulator [Saccharibacillus alkalitolerans]